MIHGRVIAGAAAALSQAGYITASMLTPVGQGAGSVTMTDGAGGVAITATQPTAFLLPQGYANVRVEALLRVAAHTGEFLFGPFVRGSVITGNLAGYILPGLRITGANAAAGQGRCLPGVTPGSSNSLGGAGVGEFTPPGTISQYTSGADILMQVEVYCADLGSPSSPTAYRARAFLATEDALLGNVPAWQMQDTTITRTYGTEFYWQTETGTGFVIPIPAGTVEIRRLLATPIGGLS